MSKHRCMVAMGTCLAAVLTSCTSPRTTARLATPVPTAVPATADTLREPIVLQSVPTQVNGQTIGILDVRLEAVMDSVQPGGTGGWHVVRAYRLTWANGRSYDIVSQPGPTLRVNPGDSVRILLTNNLPPDPHPHQCQSYPVSKGPPNDKFPNCFHGPNTTNIHYHGMHVTPSGTGDNVLLEIGPDSSFQFAYRIPMNQASGTMWYHPHKHGSVALQVMNGMAGALVVGNGRLDRLTESLNMIERTIAVQQIDSQINLVAGNTGEGAKLVNGQINPIVYMRPGEVQRWRLVNENISNSTTYALVFGSDATHPGPQMFDIARDGVQYAPANYDPRTPDESLIVAPGNRLDMFVRAPTQPGTHRLLARLVHQPGARFELPHATGKAGVAQPLMTVVVVNDGATRNRVLPDSLPDLPGFLNNLPAPAANDTAARLVFMEIGDNGIGPKVAPDFYLGTDADSLQKFNPDVPFIQMPLGKVQTWKVTNRSKNLSHPFHIHINPFQIMHVSYSPTDGNAPLYKQMNDAAARGFPIWSDTFALPKNGYIVVRQRYDDFTGKFVMHCHILGHEERGMMQLLEIVGN